MPDDRLLRDLDHVVTRTRDVWEQLRDARVFLTGGTGFFGCWLLESFAHAVDQLALSAQITVLTRDPGQFSKKAPHLSAHPAIHLLQGDVRSFTFPDGAFSHIIHGATDVAGTLNADDPEAMIETIEQGTARVLKFREKSGASRALLLSSGAVYGRQPTSVTHMPEEEDAVARPLETPSAYAEGKRSAETLWNTHGPIARGYAFVGPHLPLDAHLAIGNFIRDALRGGPITVKGDGTPRRSYLYAADLTIWLWTMLTRGKPGRAYNVGSEDDDSIAEVAQTVSACVGTHPAVIIGKTPVPGAPPERYVPSTARARSELGLEQTVPLDEAIRRTAAWYSSKPIPPIL